MTGAADIGAAALLLAIASAPAAASGTLPAAEQTALVQKYCAVCHTDAHPNGGLSLQHFDAARPEPQVAAMIASKLRNGAMDAAGIKPPDKTVQDALLNAMTAGSVGSARWLVKRSTPQRLSASVVRQVSSGRAGDPDLYRLTVTCDLTTRTGELQLAWSPAVPKPHREIFAAADNAASQRYTVEGSEKMGNGAGGDSGPGAMVLDATSLPARALTVSNVFQAQTVVFPFDSLDPSARRSLAACFDRPTSN